MPALAILSVGDGCNSMLLIGLLKLYLRNLMVSKSSVLTSRNRFLSRQLYKDFVKRLAVLYSSDEILYRLASGIFLVMAIFEHLA